MQKLSVVLATRNEEQNIGTCLDSIKQIADELIIVDENSTDQTREIAKSFGAKIYLEPHHEIFHITKQKALDYAKNPWILQLDADEIITPELSEEITKVINMSDSELEKYNQEVLTKNKLFQRHQKLIEKRDGKFDTNKEICAFFIARRNFFLGKPLIHAGVYPDPAIRLIKKDKAGFPMKSVHEIMWVNGTIGWLQHAMLHNDSPTLRKYLMRLNRYTDLKAQEFEVSKLPKNLFYLFLYTTIKPLSVFMKLYFRHKGFKDDTRGFLWSIFSASHYPIAYYKYYTNK